VKTSLTVVVCGAALAFLALAPFAARADTPRDAMVVSTAWLAQHLNDPGLVLFHVGDEKEYPAEHIRGARLLRLRDISSDQKGDDALALEMPAPETLHAQLEALGISDTSRIVVYGAKDWISPVTRAVFTFLYAGLENVSMLDGGLEAWTKEKRDVTTAVPPAKRGTLSRLTLKPMLADAAFVQAHAGTPGFVVIDARDGSYYDGIQKSGAMEHHMAGHIPGSKSLPFEEVNGEDLKLKPAVELESIFAKAGVKPGDTVIGYCHVGQQATAMLFAARSLGHPVLLYDGSYEDWARRGLPIDNPAKK
jgi:thiosulfate/3-mercaptopyruvate sulfurtransferase